MSPLALTREQIEKFNIPGPRYTSYPTAPTWTSAVDDGVYRTHLARFAGRDAPLSLYVHLPFCHSLCYYCGCAKLIRDAASGVAETYLDHLLQEIDLVAATLGSHKRVVQLHWGGGTPTFLTGPEIERLFTRLDRAFTIDRAGEIAIETDPRTITPAKLALLKQLGFNRLSIGVQDLTPAVQKAVNRVHPYPQVKSVFEAGRALGFESINIDLIYGLPHQTVANFTDTLDKIIRLRPDRIALYSYAYVPWLKKSQTAIDESALPTPPEKLSLFLAARDRLCAGGYEAIAMDHFALAHDALAEAYRRGTLHRNFMGYTLQPADTLIGLGYSAIGFLEGGYFQNVKDLAQYYARVKGGKFPIDRGKLLDQDDRIRQWVITQLMCRFQLDKRHFRRQFGRGFDEYFAKASPHLDYCAQEALLRVSPDVLEVTDLGRLFVRNICMGFDRYLQEETQRGGFSKTV